jgi:hypothetical protein
VTTHRAILNLLLQLLDNISVCIRRPDRGIDLALLFVEHAIFLRHARLRVQERQTSAPLAAETRIPLRRLLHHLLVILTPEFLLGGREIKGHLALVLLSCQVFILKILYT